jgi:hypothetical protein
VKEHYFYLDSTPTHSYMKALYKYPQREFPYGKLVEENRRRNRTDFEYELLDTGAFAENRYFDVFTEYAKASAEDILIKITATNRGPAEADLSLLPTIWFRNTWSWGRDTYRPALRAIQQLSIPKEYGIPGSGVIEVEHKAHGKRWLLCEGEPELLFTENETNARKLFGGENRTSYVKDGINDYVVHGNREAVNSEKTGTKASALYRLRLAPGASATLRLRLSGPFCGSRGAVGRRDRRQARYAHRGDRTVSTTAIRRRPGVAHSSRLRKDPWARAWHKTRWLRCGEGREWNQNFGRTARSVERRR